MFNDVLDNDKKRNLFFKYLSAGRYSGFCFSISLKSSAASLHLPILSLITAIINLKNQCNSDDCIFLKKKSEAF